MPTLWPNLLPEQETRKMSLPLNQVIVGDCTEVMKAWPADSIDCIVTDPPYGLNFMGKEWDKALPSREAFEQMFRVLKPGGLAFMMSSPRQDVLWRMLAMLEGVGFELRQSFISWIYKTGFPKAYDVSKGIDKKLGLEREVIGRSPHFSLGRKRTWGDGIKYGMQEGTDEETDWITEPNSDEAKQWDGWKSQTGLKPALEPILMVNKPFSEPTIVDNVLRWGVGAINVDATRIPFKGQEDKDGTKVGFTYFGARNALELSNHEDYPKLEYNPDMGRFPANLLVSDGEIVTGKTTKSGKFEPHHKIAKDEKGYSVKNVYGKYRYLPADQQVFYGDEGSPYRFFDLDAWAEHHWFLDVAKPSRAERDFGLGGFEEKEVVIGNEQLYERSGARLPPKSNYLKRRNTHPTVKPIKLMAYLIALGCPRNGVVVDPFLGSGTTCIAAKKLRRKWIGIEIDPEYAAIAEARINIRGPLDQYTTEAPTVE